MNMAQTAQEEVERTTVYLTARNKQRLKGLRRGEKTKKLNEALNKAFEGVEREKAFEAFMYELDSIELVKPVMSSIEAIRLLREGRDHEVSDKRKT
jgi:uncharacterized membrane protein YqiK